MSSSTVVPSEPDVVAFRERLGLDIEVNFHPMGLPARLSPLTAELSRDPVAFREWFVAREGAIDDLLVQYGAISFTGFAVADTAAFSALIDHYPSDARGYSGGATSRSVIVGKVFEATRSPADVKLGLHQEMAYLPRWPAKLAFWCKVAPQAGGATIIADVRRFEPTVPRRFYHELRARGVCYCRNFRAPGPFEPQLLSVHRSWQETFYTEDPAKAEADCAAMGLEPRWEDDGSLSAIYVCDGFVTHPTAGSTHWFNHVATQTMTPNTMRERWPIYARTYAGGRPRPYETRYGDGGEIAIEDVMSLYSVFDAVTVVSPWRSGDLMLIDNVMTFHGRDPFVGERDVQVALLGTRTSSRDR